MSATAYIGWEGPCPHARDVPRVQAPRPQRPPTLARVRVRGDDAPGVRPHEPARQPEHERVVSTGNPQINPHGFTPSDPQVSRQNMDSMPPTPQAMKPIGRDCFCGYPLVYAHDDIRCSVYGQHRTWFRRNPAAAGRSLIDLIVEHERNAVA